MWSLWYRKEQEMDQTMCWPMTSTTSWSSWLYFGFPSIQPPHFLGDLPRISLVRCHYQLQHCPLHDGYRDFKGKHIAVPCFPATKVPHTDPHYHNDHSCGLNLFFPFGFSPYKLGSIFSSSVQTQCLTEYLSRMFDGWPWNACKQDYTPFI